MSAGTARAVLVGTYARQGRGVRVNALTHDEGSAILKMVLVIALKHNDQRFISWRSR